MNRHLILSLSSIGSILLLGSQTPNVNPPAQHQPNYVEDYVDVEAIGVPPSDEQVGSSAAYAEARESAKLVASRSLAQQLRGMLMDSVQKIDRSGTVVRQDSIDAVMHDFRAPAGFIVQESSYEDFQRENMVRLVERYKLSDALAMLGTPQMAQLRVDAEKEIPRAPLPALPASPVETPAYDALIVKVPEQFQPSLGTRIFNSEGSLVYGQSSMAAGIRLMQPLNTQFTTTEDRARAGLEAQGSKNPLVITGNLFGPKKEDISLDDDAAHRVMQENTRGHFFERGRVYVVVGSSI